MKKWLLSVSGIILFTTGVVFAEIDTALLDQRQANQHQRIDQGISSEQLNEQKEQVNKMEKQGKVRWRHDGKGEGQDCRGTGSRCTPYRAREARSSG